jgi:hypothetical protein
MAKKAEPAPAPRGSKLREKIEKLASDPESREQGAEPLSPREFIQKRMAELDKKKQK